MVGLTPAVGLLASAVQYGLGCLAEVDEGTLSRPTPCAGRDLEALLCHVTESVAALREGVDSGCIALEAPDTAVGGTRAELLVGGFRDGARQLLDGWRRLAAGAPTMRVGGAPIAGGLVALVGALEIAVHGWDIAEACGSPRPIPVRLSLDMLRWTPQIVDATARGTFFAPPLRISPLASPSDRLVAYLGRNPRSWAEGG